jgi:glycosyltransferase involved in cell wall biosynthesis
MTKAKKLLLIEANTDGTIGGSHYCLLEIVQRIDRNKYEPIVLFFERNSLEDAIKAFCPVFVVPCVKPFNLSSHTPPRLNGISAIRFGVSMAQKLANFVSIVVPGFFWAMAFIARNRVDIVHLNNCPDLSDWLTASKLLGVKCSAHLRGNWKPAPRSFQRWLVGHYDWIIAISGSVKEILQNEGIATKRISVIHDGINLQPYVACLEPQAWREMIGSSSASFVIGVVGNIKPWKGQHVVVEAMHILRSARLDVKCLMVGDVGRLREDQEYFSVLNERVRGLGLEQDVIFTGFRRDVLPLMKEFAVIVHSSTEPEPLGRVILEGMLMGRPVIATAHGGPLEIIVDGESGFLVPPDNPAVLAERLAALLDDEDLRSRMGANARRRVCEDFGLDAKVREIEDQLDQIVSGNGSPSGLASVLARLRS